MSGTIQLEIMELKNSIEDLREKLAVEFNKKRKMKLDYEEKIASLNEELHFLKEVKYPEMRELLSNCNQQLREFEDLNLMRNEVIERLEKENAVLKSMIQAPPNRQQYFI
jgi:predicted nuclease with TOPRIM domain